MLIRQLPVDVLKKPDNWTYAPPTAGECVCGMIVVAKSPCTSRHACTHILWWDVAMITISSFLIQHAQLIKVVT